MKRGRPKLLKPKRAYKRKPVSKQDLIINQITTHMDAVLSGDLQAVADKDAATFDVVITVPPTEPVKETTRFAPGTPPVII